MNKLLAHAETLFLVDDSPKIACNQREKYEIEVETYPEGSSMVSTKSYMQGTEDATETCNAILSITRLQSTAKNASFGWFGHFKNLYAWHMLNI